MEMLNKNKTKGKKQGKITIVHLNELQKGLLEQTLVNIYSRKINAKKEQVENRACGNEQAEKVALHDKVV